MFLQRHRTEGRLKPSSCPPPLFPVVFPIQSGRIFHGNQCIHEKINHCPAFLLLFQIEKASNPIRSTQTPTSAVIDNPKKKHTQPPTTADGETPRKGPIDPKEKAIRYKAFRHIFTEKEIAKGLDEKTILKKLRRSKNLAGRYQQYVEMMEDSGGRKRIYPWHNPFNKVLFWTVYWTPKMLKWSSLVLLLLLVINYIPGPTQHIIEVIVARAIYDTAPVDRLPDSLETYAHSAQIVDLHGTAIKSYGKRQVTQQIPEKAQKAVLACEDHYLLPHPNHPWYVNAFLVHPGVSWPNIAGAVVDLFRGHRRGASTIVMQNAKKIIGNTKRSVANKLEEIILSYMMVTKFGKEKNLNFYVNTVPVGANIYGFPAAAANYFKKDLSQLNYQQLVAIGAFIPNHHRQIAFYEILKGRSLAELGEDLARHAKSAINKVNLALAHLRGLGEISEAEYRAWLLSDEESIRRIGFRDFRSPLYGEEEWTSWNVIKEVTSRSYRINGREVSGTQLILDERGDVVIETAVNLQLVEKIKQSIADYLGSSAFVNALRRSNQNSWQRDQEQYLLRKIEPPYSDFESFMEFLRRHLNVGVIAINQKGEVVAYVGGKEFLKNGTEENGLFTEPEVAPAEEDANNVIIDLMNKQAKISPSSTIKPLIAYFSMLAGNVKMEHTFTDRPLEYKYLKDEGRQVWLPRNWYDYDAAHPMGHNYSLLEAQVISINTIFARLFTNRPVRDAMLAAFDEIGLDYNKEDAKYWPFGIGASDVPVQQWLGVYNAFLDGNYRAPSFVKRITVNGEVVYQRDTDTAHHPTPFLDAKKEREEEMRALYEICNRGTASSMKTEFTYHKNLVSGKTGTAPNERSALFISHFNPYRDRTRYPEHNLTMLVAVTTNTGGHKSVGSSSLAPAKIAGMVYSHLFQQELQRMMDTKLEDAKRTNTHFRNNHVYWGNVNRYLDSLMNGKCGTTFIHENVIGVDGYGEALEQILNSTNQIYTGRDTIFQQLVQYYCDQAKTVKMEPAAAP